MILKTSMKYQHLFFPFVNFFESMKNMSTNCAVAYVFLCFAEGAENYRFCSLSLGIKSNRATRVFLWAPNNIRPEAAETSCHYQVLQFAAKIFSTKSAKPPRSAPGTVRNNGGWRKNGGQLLSAGQYTALLVAADCGAYL